MDETLSFDELQNQIQTRYQAGEYAAAYQLATAGLERFPGQTPLLVYWQVCMAARLERAEQSIHILEQALQDGLWFSEFLLRKSPSLLPLQGLVAYERVVAFNRQLQTNDEDLHFPLITLRSQGKCATGGPPCPLLVGLHGNASTARAGLDFWQPAAGRGWLVAAPQSTQAMWKGAYMWDDYDAACAQVERQLKTLAQQYAVNPERVVLAGHSMGGETAIRLALSGAIPAAGIIAFGPGGPLMDEPDAWLPYIEQAAGRIRQTAQPLSAILVYGDADTDISVEGIVALADHLNRAGIPCDVERVPGAKHAFQPEYAAELQAALDEFEDAWTVE